MNHLPLHCDEEMEVLACSSHLGIKVTNLTHHAKKALSDSSQNLVLLYMQYNASPFAVNLRYAFMIQVYWFMQHSKC